MKTYTKESLIAALIGIRSKGWIRTTRKNNDAGIGNTLENLLGIEENNLPLPNAAEWELKSQKKNSTSLITLFHLEPSPRAYKFVPKILLPEFGWPHKDGGTRYTDEEKSFRQTINAKGYSNRGFSVKVDWNQKKVFIDFSVDKVDNTTHPNWYEMIKDKSLEPKPYWGFEDLFHKAGIKLHNCFFVRAEAKKIKGNLCFHYQDIYMLKKFDLNKFIQAVSDGNIYIDFDARTGHNHGTKFRLNREAFVNLYAEVKAY